MALNLFSFLHHKDVGKLSPTGDSLLCVVMDVDIWPSYWTSRCDLWLTFGLLSYLLLALQIFGCFLNNIHQNFAFSASPASWMLSWMLSDMTRLEKKKNTLDILQV